MPRKEGWKKSHPAAGGPRLPGSLGNSRVLTVLIVRGDDRALGSCQRPAESRSGLLALLVGSLFPSFASSPTSCSPPSLPSSSASELSPPLLPPLLTVWTASDTQAPRLPLLPWTCPQKAWPHPWEPALLPPCPLPAPSLHSHWKFPLD